MKNIVTQLFNAWDIINTKAAELQVSAMPLYIEFLYCYIRYGCLPRQFVNGEFCKKRKFERKDILTYRKICKIYDKLNLKQDIYLLENKAEFNKLFSDFIHREWILSSEHTPEEIETFVKKHGKVIVKPYNEMEGHGIYELSYDTNIDYEKLSSQKLMIEEILQQHESLIFNNKSINTIRVHTLTDEKGEVHILSCILRAGVGKTIVDNYNSGGVIYPVDIELGIVEGKGVSRNGNNHIIHPQSNIIMLGYKIPNWEILKKEIKRASSLIPTLNFVGWDVVITSNGIALIEGNHNPDYELFEFIGKGKSYKQIQNILKKK